MRQFENLVKKDQVFDVKIVWRSSQGKEIEIPNKIFLRVFHNYSQICVEKFLLSISNKL